MHTRYCNLQHFRSYLLPLDMWNVINFGWAKYNIWKIVIEHHATYTRASHTYRSSTFITFNSSECEKSLRALRPFIQLEELKRSYLNG